jgi:hypothetical protein
MAFRGNGQVVLLAFDHAGAIDKRFAAAAGERS